MDILISSNLERLLCLLVGQEECKKKMEDLKHGGRYEMTKLPKDMVGQWATEEETARAIKEMFAKTGYILDPHTAVAYASYEKYKAETHDKTPALIVSTASPYKFTKDVMKAIDESYGDAEFFPLMEEMEKKSGVPIPSPIRGIENRPIRHQTVIEKDAIKTFVKDYYKGEYIWTFSS